MKKGAENFRKSKKAQFYIIAAVVIVIVIMGFATVSNYVQVKKTPEKFYDLGDVLKLEGSHVIENALYTDKSVNENIEAYLALYSDYIEKNTNEDFNIVIFYGNISAADDVTAKFYSRKSEGSVNLYLGTNNPFTVQGGKTVMVNSTQVQVIGSDKKSVEVTINHNGLNITQTLPVLEDNNFVFLMTSNDEFNTYVQNSLNRTSTV